LTQQVLAFKVADRRGRDIVPIWIERFALAVFAAAFFGLVILNILKMDWIQRTGLGIGIIGFSIFLAQTLHASKVKVGTDMSQGDPKKPDVQQRSEGANSPNTNILGNNNTVSVNPSDPAVHRKLDEITKLLKSQGGKDKLLEKYPLGYVIFDLDYVTSAVTPLETRKGLEAYQYDFRPVKVLENTNDRISIQLPDLIKDKKVILQGRTGGIKRVGNLGGYMAEADGVGVMVWGEILAIKESEITFLVGFERAPKMPRPK
jgi:hypothetical protein